MKRLTRNRIAAVLAAGLGTSLVAPASPAEMSGDDILKRSARAYTALKSYRGATTAQGKMWLKDGPVSMTGTARIVFTRPNRIRIDGKDSFGNNYWIESDGKRTTVSSGRPFSKPETAENVERAIAGRTGVANSAPTHIPALLMDLKWGHPYAGVQDVRLAGREKIGGKETYRVVAKGENVTRTYWVDTASFLLRQMKEEQTAQQLEASGVPAASKREVVYSFRIDQAVAAPGGAVKPER